MTQNPSPFIQKQLAEISPENMARFKPAVDALLQAWKDDPQLERKCMDDIARAVRKRMEESMNIAAGPIDTPEKLLYHALIWNYSTAVKNWPNKELVWKEYFVIGGVVSALLCEPIRAYWQERLRQFEKNIQTSVSDALPFPHAPSSQTITGYDLLGFYCADRLEEALSSACVAPAYERIEAIWRDVELNLYYAIWPDGSRSYIRQLFEGALADTHRERTAIYAKERFGKEGRINGWTSVVTSTESRGDDIALG